MTTALATAPVPLNLNHLSDQEVLLEFFDSHRNHNQSKARLLIAIQNIDARNICHSQGFNSTTAYVAHSCDLNYGTAKEYVFVARSMADFVYASKAFAAGEISYSALRLLLRYLTGENEFDLVDAAKVLPLAELRRFLSGSSPAEPDSPVEDQFRVRVEDDGRVTGSFNLSPSDGAALFAALKIGELAFHDALDAMMPEELLDDDSVNAKFAEVVSDTIPDVSLHGPPPASMMVSALQGLINIARSQPVSALRAPAAHVNITMSEDGHASLPGQLGAAPERLSNLVENGAFELDLMDSKGVVIHVGRKKRLATPRQVKALLVQWGHKCATPGCTHTRYIEIHHMHEWAHGGLTNMDNLLPLCSSCHARVTNGLMEIEAIGADIHFRLLDGSWYISHRRGLPVLQDEKHGKNFLGVVADKEPVRDWFDDLNFDD